MTRVLGVVLGLGLAGAAGRADDRPLDRADLDRRVVKAGYETAVLGTELFNAGKHDECFRLYQGTLLAVQPLLDHRPKLAASVLAKMDKARGMKAAEGAFVLRDALDEIQNEIAPGGKPEPKSDAKVEPKKATLWDRLGGDAGVKKLVDDLVVVAIEDPKVNLTRGKPLDGAGVAALRQNLVGLIAAAADGPAKDPKATNGLKLAAAEFDALAEVLKEVLKKSKVAPADADELVKRVGAAKKDHVEDKGM
jgi:hemoglobin